MLTDTIVEMALLTELAAIQEGAVTAFLFPCIMRIGNVCGEDCKGCPSMFTRNSGPYIIHLTIYNDVYYLPYNVIFKYDV